MSSPPNTTTTTAAGSPTMPSSPPKSCLKRSSLPTNIRHAYIDDVRRAASPDSALTDDGDPYPTSGGHAHAIPPPRANTAHGRRARPKAVSFCSDDDVLVFYPWHDPLHRQARKQVVRLFRACAEAFRIDSPYLPAEPPVSRRGSDSSTSSSSSSSSDGSFDDDDL
ncbi:hypothetical protein C8Q77DRAFT_224881 [Trametes polyzona]|nr:hypothetical protein C8Q77DRAFT_224881 [Trametes polyzona]